MLWDVMACSLVGVGCSFRGTFCLLAQLTLLPEDGIPLKHQYTFTKVHGITSPPPQKKDNVPIVAAVRTSYHFLPDDLDMLRSKQTLPRTSGFLCLGHLQSSSSCKLRVLA